jgi:hypothetical protein
LVLDAASYRRACGQEEPAVTAAAWQVAEVALAAARRLDPSVEPKLRDDYRRFVAARDARNRAQVQQQGCDRLNPVVKLSEDEMLAKLEEAKQNFTRATAPGARLGSAECATRR